MTVILMIVSILLIAIVLLQSGKAEKSFRAGRVLCDFGRTQQCVFNYGVRRGFVVQCVFDQLGHARFYLHFSFFVVANFFDYGVLGGGCDFRATAVVYG